MKIHSRILVATCCLLVAIPLMSSLPAVAATKKPKIVKAKMVDRDGNGLADRVVLTFSRKIKHRLDKDGSYPLRIKGYEIKKILGAHGTRKLKVNLVEKADAPAAPAIRYVPTRRQPVTDMKRRQAKRQKFLGVVPLPPVLTNSVNVSTQGPGSVMSVPAGIDCGTACRASFEPGSVVALTAIPDAAVPAVFTGWGGDCATFAEAPVCVLTIDGPKTVSAAFADAASTAMLTVTKLGPGTVLSVPPGLDCGTVCAADFEGVPAVTLTAIPDPGANFAGWGGDCASFAAVPECILTMDAGKTVTAMFTEDLPGDLPLDLSLLGTGAGEVTSVPAGILCSADDTLCSILFPEGSLVTLTAAPELLSVFGGWGGDCASFGIAPVCVLTMDAAKTVTAAFNPLL